MILSVSRRTDIPAFYSKWFFTRLQQGYVYVPNPLNKKQISKIVLNPSLIDCIVFWTKNPKQIIPYLDYLEEQNYIYYFHFTLNPYKRDLEPNLPKKKEIVDTFQKLSRIVGSKRIIWRYDPIIISDSLSVEYHIRNFEKLSSLLQGYTNKCIISFIDLYEKCKRNMRHVKPKKIEDNTKRFLGHAFFEISKKKGIAIETCAEKTGLEDVGIPHGKCIDDHLISDLSGFELDTAKDKNQRDDCGCVSSIDIGSYNTCKHCCLYCYANYNNELVQKNYLLHNPKSPLLVGEVENSDKINTRIMKSNFIRQKSLF